MTKPSLRDFLVSLALATVPAAVATVQFVRFAQAGAEPWRVIASGVAMGLLMGLVLMVVTGYGLLAMISRRSEG